MSKFLTEDEIKRTFQDFLNQKSNDDKKSNIDKALRNISKSVKRLQQAGLDISIDVHRMPNTMAFAMFTPPSRVPIAGVIKISDVQLMFAIGEMEGNTKDILSLRLSYHDIRYHHQGEVAYRAYDLKDESSEPYKIFQKNLLETAAQKAVVDQYDISDVFNKERKRPVFKTTQQVLPNPQGNSVQIKRRS